MKSISLFLISCLVATVVVAQTVSTVTINVKGNNHESIVVDGKEYLISNDNTTNSNTPIVVSNLQAGQHTLQIKRSNDINPASTVFTTRTGYDLQITIAANGSVQSKEIRWRPDNNTADYAVAMSATDFNTLYYSIRNRSGANTKMTLVSDAFSNTSNYFTTAQVRQLIQLINNQSNRFTLLKASYRSVTDRTNFNQLYDLVNSQSYKDQLEDYVSSYNAGSSSTAMTTASFNSIYRTAQRQSTVNAKVSYIYNTFANTSNYFTVAQASRLIQLISDEPNRLYLAKISYRSIVDKANFGQINNLLNSQSGRHELNVFVNNYDEKDPVYTKVAMKDAEFNTLYRDIQNRWGLGVKMAALRDAFANQNSYFTTAQTRRLILLVSSESNRLELAKLSYDNIVDQANFNQLYDVFSSSSARNEIEVYIRDHQSDDPVYTTKTPMSNASFSNLYDEVRTTWGIGAKMSRLTDIFNTETYYFTVAQAKQLIQLVSSESNRLELAKSAYGNITDPQNFNLMYDVLASESNRTALAAYVNSYSYSR